MYRKDAEVTKTQFKQSEDYETFHTVAREITSFTIHSEVVLEFREISKRVEKFYDENKWIGPTGQGYAVTKEMFRKVFPSYLQSFELTLISQSIFKTIEKYSEVELLGHMHDGNVIGVPDDLREEVLDGVHEW